MLNRIQPIHLLTIAAAVPAIALVLFVHGAVPNLYLPTFGQAVWALGFAKSIGNHWSIFAHDIGYPAPAAIAFGLPAVLTMAALLKAGLDGANAYASSFAIWLIVAFWGAYLFARRLDAGRLFSIVAATVWMTTPILWAHQSYSMLVLGFGLLPFYMRCAWPIIWRDEPTLAALAVFLGSAILSVFMDGYSFVCFGAGASLVWLLQVVKHEEPRWLSLRRCVMLLAGFAVAFVLYTAFIGRSLDKYPIDFFRAWGANIEFLLIPTRGMLWLPDTLGFSEARPPGAYFGDASTFATSFSLLAILLAVAAWFSRKGDRAAILVFIVIGLVGFYLSLGPSFKLYALKPADVPGPTMAQSYAPILTGTGVLSKYVPGLMTMRASYRWALLGIFGAWAVFVAGAAERKSTAGWPIWAALFVVAMNLPHPTLLGAYKSYRAQFLAADAYTASVKKDFHLEERVLFLPYGNDFFATYLAPNIGIRSFNVGGDKNVSSAIPAWPAVIRAVKPREMGDKTKITAILTSHAADAVALTFIDNFTPAFGWPVPQVHKDDALRLADQLEMNPDLAVVRTADYAIIRLR